MPGLANSGCAFPAPSSHCNSEESAACSAAAVNQRSGLGEIELCRTVCGVVADLVEYWGGRPVNFQPIQVERYSKQCASVHVNQMAAGQIATERAASHECFRCGGPPKKSLRCWPRRTKPPPWLSREQHGLASGQNLRPAVAEISVLQLGHWCWRASGGRNPR